MSWQDFSAVLDAQLSLDQTLHKVAPRSEDADNGSESHPLGKRKSVCEIPYCCSGNERDDAAANASYPRLMGGDARKELVGDVTSEERAYEVSTGVVGPKTDEDGKRVYPVVLQAAFHRIVMEADERYEREG